MSIIEQYNLTAWDKKEVQPQPQLKPIDEVAKEVIRGEWGNGEDRKARLTQAGYDYNVIQARANEMLRPQPQRKSIDEIAREVIRGKWGNNPERKRRLEGAGYDYSAVQARVNQLIK